jgi:hypothetical protein
MPDDAMDAEAVRTQLAQALAGQLGSLVALTVLSGAVRGPATTALKDRLLEFATAEVADSHRLVEKLAALGGGVPPVDVPTLPDGDLTARLRWFLEREDGVLSSLHAVIGPSGQEPQSEALEHLIEHVLLRKQQQVDFLRLALE